MSVRNNSKKSNSYRPVDHEPASENEEELKARAPDQQKPQQHPSSAHNLGKSDTLAESEVLLGKGSTGTTTSDSNKMVQLGDGKGSGEPPSQPADAAAAAAPKGPVIPEVLMFHKDPDRDDFGVKSFFEAMTNPMTYHYVRFAFRSTCFVCFPLFTLALHPNTMARLQFPSLVIASIVSFSTNRATFGEQMGVHSWVWRGLAYGFVICTFAHASGIVYHVGAWYGLIALGIFLASLIKHSWMRRFFYLYFFLEIMMLRMQQHMLGGVPDHSISYFTADHLIGSLLGMAALLFPYPVLTRDFADIIITKLFTGLATMIGGMLGYIASPDLNAADVFFSDMTPFEKLETGLAAMPALLWFVSREPLEFPLRNPIRRLKLALMRRILALTYAAFESGKTIVRLKKQIADYKAMIAIRQEMMDLAGRKSLADREADAAEERAKQDSEFARRKAKDEVDQAGIETLRQNSAEHTKAFASVLIESIKLVGSTKPQPKTLVKKVPFGTLEEKDVLARRNHRVELLQVMYVQRQKVERLQKQRANEETEAANHRKKNDKSSFGAREADSPTVVDVNDPTFSAPYGHRAAATDVTAGVKRKDTARPKTNQPSHVRFGGKTGWAYTETDDEMGQIFDYQMTLSDVEVYLTLNMLAFKMLMGMIATELESFGEMMANYKPTKALWRRIFEFFITEPWHDFWHCLWEQVTFSTPQSVRTLKDAIKIVCAYLSACALSYELWIPEGGLYFFGVTTLLGMPVEEESVVLCICRMAGNTLGCALGFLCYHNTNNLAQQIASTLCFTFLMRCFEKHPVVGQAFFYGAIITLAGLTTSLITMELLMRTITGIYSVGAYTVCCMVVFPTNPSKVLWGYRMKFTKIFSELLDDIALAARVPLQGNYGAGDDSNASDMRRVEAAPFGGNEELADVNGREPAAPAGGATRKNSQFDAKSKNVLSSSVRLEGLGYYLGDPADAMCSRLNVQVRLLNEMLNLSAKWTPFAASYPYIRGIDKFPTAASLHVLLCHQRLTAHMQLLVFSTQLLHRPRDEPLDPKVQRILVGPFAHFLDEFSGAMRLLSQDFIDSLQKPRTFTYPLYLSHVGNLSRMRSRVHTISYECYVFLANLSRGPSAGMTAEDYDALRAEQVQRRESQLSRVQVEDTAGGHSVNTDDLLSTRQKATTAAPAGEPPASGPPGNLQEYRSLNASFADSFLLRQQSAGPTSAVVSPRGRLDITTPSASGGGGVGNNTFVGVSSGSFARRGYRSQPPLCPAREEPDVCYPLAPEDPEREMRATLAHLKQQKKSEDKPTTGDDAVDFDPQSGGRSDKNQPAQPKHTRNALAKTFGDLVQTHSPHPESLVPRYEGPDFSYREDALESPTDTDVTALVGILSSCMGIISDMERMACHVGEISRYQKQIHETTFILSLLDTVSVKVHAYRKATYARYHYPPPPPEKRNLLHAQDDVWREWRF